jgi:hypothetical protein
MWHSNKKPAKVRKSALPPSERQLLWAKQDRLANRTEFHHLESQWTSKKRGRQIEVEVEEPVQTDSAMPAWMNYRKKPVTPPMYFRTKAVVKSPPKKPA